MNGSADRDLGPETLYLEGRCFPEAIETERSAVTTQISELGRALRPVRVVVPVSDRAAVTTVEPVPRIALRQQEASASLGRSQEFFVEHVRPYLRVVRRGRKRLFTVAELRCAVDEMAANVREPHGQRRHPRGHPLRLVERRS